MPISTEVSGPFDLDDPEPQQDDRQDPQASAEYAFSTLVEVDGTVEVERVTEAFARDFDIEGNPGGLGILSLVHEDDLPVARRGLEQLAGAREFVAELRMITGEGSARWMHFYALPVMRDGRVVRVLGGMLDIGERKAAEDHLRVGIELLKKTEEEPRSSRTLGGRTPCVRWTRWSAAPSNSFER
jgi:PAS domain-containing protein